jgi:hypothetical protein
VDLDDLLDHSEEDEELIEISRYQVLLNQLQQNSRSKRAAIKDDNNKCYCGSLSNYSQCCKVIKGVKSAHC